MKNGFRPGRNCQDHIFALTSIIENRIQTKKDTFACFIDFRKAFDTVNRKYLWAKLEKRYGMSGGCLFIMTSCASYPEIGKYIHQMVCFRKNTIFAT